MSPDHKKVGFLGDTPQKSYVTKLDLFNRFAGPELRQFMAGLDLPPKATVLDAGCGTGLITTWLAEQTPGGKVVGIDLSAGHVQHARRLANETALPLTILQADMGYLPLGDGLFDLIWCSNTINHLHKPVAGLRVLMKKLRPQGRLILGQSAFLPEMFFAWDARLEKEVMLACRQYYRDKYGLDERDTTAARNLFGWLKAAGFNDITPKTIVIERTAPLTQEDELYFLEGVFRGYWGHRVQPYLSPEEWAELEQLCDPDSPYFCLRRPDFHHIQTFTTISGRL
jgi:SAM-dependent methyltransferase